MRWFVALLLLLGLAWGQDFSQDDYLHSFPDQRLELFPTAHWPYLGLTRKSQVEACRDKDPQTCRYEWWLPYSTVEGTQEVARKLRQAWQRFEERYWWRAQVSLNQPAFPLTYCTVGLSISPAPTPLPEVKVEARPFFFPDGYTLPLPATLAASRGAHRLDQYWPLPQVPKEDFCDGVGVELLPLMAIPPFCVTVDFLNFEWCTPGYPDEPLWFNETEASDKVQKAIQHGLKQYFPEYQADVMKALAPQLDISQPTQAKVFAPLPWAAHLSGAGTILAAVADLDIARNAQTLREMADLLRQANLGKLERGLLLPYYGQSFLALSRIAPFDTVVGPVCQALAGCAEGLLDQALRTAAATSNLSGLKAPYAPGFWKLEQLKRYFPPSHPLIQEVFGYASFFQVYNQLTVSTVPDPTARWAPGEYALAQVQRMLGYWFVPFKLRIVAHDPWVIPTPDLPRMRPVAPYLLPYTLERTHYSWVSVPEGYLIPRVKGLPGASVTGFTGWDFDNLYRPLLR